MAAAVDIEVAATVKQLAERMRRSLGDLSS